MTVNREFLLRVSYVEIYNEVIKDLLKPGNENLKIHQNPNGEIFVGDLTEHVVASLTDVENLLSVGDSNRHIGETNMNEKSSRSHTIFRMNLVDLAGSERVGHTGAEGIRLKEGGHINKSLLALSTVISKLSEGRDSVHIPYRDSKLTRMLQSSLGGNAKTGIICTITPSLIHMDETLSTLRFASRAKTITNKPRVNEIVPEGTLLKIYKQEINELKKKLDQANESSRLSDISKEELLENREKIKLEAKIKKLGLMILDSSKIKDSSNDLQKKRQKRRQTWVPSILDSGKLADSIGEEIVSSANEILSLLKRITNDDLQEKDIHDFEILKLYRYIANIKSELSLLKNTNAASEESLKNEQKRSIPEDGELEVGTKRLKISHDSDLQQAGLLSSEIFSDLNISNIEELSTFLQVNIPKLAKVPKLEENNMELIEQIKISTDKLAEFEKIKFDANETSQKITEAMGILSSDKQNANFNEHDFVQLVKLEKSKMQNGIKTIFQLLSKSEVNEQDMDLEILETLNLDDRIKFVDSLKESKLARDFTTSMSAKFALEDSSLEAISTHILQINQELQDKVATLESKNAELAHMESTNKDLSAQNEVLLNDADTLKIEIQKYADEITNLKIAAENQNTLIEGFQNDKRIYENEKNDLQKDYSSQKNEIADLKIQNQQLLAQPIEITQLMNILNINSDGRVLNTIADIEPLITLKFNELESNLARMNLGQEQYQELVIRLGEKLHVDTVGKCMLSELSKDFENAIDSIIDEKNSTSKDTDALIQLVRSKTMKEVQNLPDIEKLINEMFTSCSNSSSDYEVLKAELENSTIDNEILSRKLQQFCLLNDALAKKEFGYFENLEQLVSEKDKLTENYSYSNELIQVNQELSEALGILQAEFQSLKKENLEYQEQIENNSIVQKKLQNQIAEQNSTAVADFSNLKDAYESQTVELESLASKLEELANETTAKKDKISEVENSLKEKEIINIKLQTQIDENVKSIDLKDAQIEQLSQSIENLQSSVEMNVDTQINDQISLLSEKNTQLQAVLQVKSDELDVLKLEQSRLSQENENLEAQTNEISSHLSEKKQQYAQLEENYSRVFSYSERCKMGMQQNIQEMTINLENNQQERLILKEKSEELQSLQSDIEKIENENEKLILTVQAYKNDIDRLNKENGPLRDCLSKLNTEYDRYRSENPDSLVELNATIETLKLDKKQLHSQVLHLAEDKKRLEVQMHESEIKTKKVISEFQLQKDTLTAEFHKLQKSAATKSVQENDVENNTPKNAVDPVKQGNTSKISQNEVIQD
ncbi:hypothetical protein HDV01_002919 [Terramyces sp. JEL0728]|nr:hypothetical protein HDV01_002919 [Terramyces sp. JEL0728]